ncbi:MAG TPA: transcriptional regulator NrdR [Candidatus Ornithospirochaeta avicola]|uniref:Transcriptional repressor NrdR n=1 Tax=Candidatus Ornithospirochaeta avicola TaxID=2840896 RepID=A0A9D1TN74_9SPIO|nr:transcriptional regulator NrdR [Candidatus Ornithospirochaeta avicola]
MKCPRCGSLEDKVLESRPSKDGLSIRRRRECLECGCRFTSYEKVELKPIVVIKKDGKHQNFDISKVERGIRACTEKIAIDPERLKETLENIENRIHDLAGSKRTVTSVQIGEETLKELYKLNHVAYVRFAAVYRAFDSLERFIEEIEKIAKES